MPMKNRKKVSFDSGTEYRKKLVAYYAPKNPA